MIINIFEDSIFNKLFKVFNILETVSSMTSDKKLIKVKSDIHTVMVGSDQDTEVNYKLSLLVYDMSCHYLRDYDWFSGLEDLEEVYENLFEYADNWKMFENMDTPYVLYMINLFVLGIQRLVLSDTQELFCVRANIMTPLNWMGGVADIEDALLKKVMVVT